MSQTSNTKVASTTVTTQQKTTTQQPAIVTTQQQSTTQAKTQPQPAPAVLPQQTNQTKVDTSASTAQKADQKQQQVVNNLSSGKSNDSIKSSSIDTGKTASTAATPTFSQGSQTQKVTEQKVDVQTKPATTSNTEVKPTGTISAQQTQNKQTIDNKQPLQPQPTKDNISPTKQLSKAQIDLNNNREKLREAQQTRLKRIENEYKKEVQLLRTKNPSEYIAQSAKMNKGIEYLRLEDTLTTLNSEIKELELRQQIEEIRKTRKIEDEDVIRTMVETRVREQEKELFDNEMAVSDGSIKKLENGVALREKGVGEQKKELTELKVSVNQMEAQKQLTEKKIALQDDRVKKMQQLQARMQQKLQNKELIKIDEVKQLKEMMQLLMDSQ